MPVFEEFYDDLDFWRKKIAGFNALLSIKRKRVPINLIIYQNFSNTTLKRRFPNIFSFSHSFQFILQSNHFHSFFFSVFQLLFSRIWKLSICVFLLIYCFQFLFFFFVVICCYPPISFTLLIRLSVHIYYALTVNKTPMVFSWFTTFIVPHSFPFLHFFFCDQLSEHKI